MLPRGANGMSGKGGITEAEWMSQQQQQNMSRKRAEVNITVCVTDRPAEEEMNEPCSEVVFHLVGGALPDKRQCVLRAGGET